MTALRIALVGERDPSVAAHPAIERSLATAARALNVELAPEWVDTERLARTGDRPVREAMGIWCVPGSPYRSMEGALRAVRVARETPRPFLGTCGGFQHALIEYFRNVIGLKEAEHAEVSPAAPNPLIRPLACPLIEVSARVRPAEGSRLQSFAGAAVLQESYRCAYGLAPSYERMLERGDLAVAARDDEGEVRAVELRGHPFFLATLFQPERRALRGGVHPIVMAFAKAVLAQANSTTR